MSQSSSLKNLTSQMMTYHHLHLLTLNPKLHSLSVLVDVCSLKLILA